VAAARLADVGAGDADPLELCRRGEHLAQQLAVAGLHPGSLGQRQAGLGDPLGQFVAQPLQLAEIENAGLGGEPGYAVFDPHPAERLGEEGGQLALEAADLAPQLETRRPLVGIDVDEEVSFQQLCAHRTHGRV
jgi:hypothetical protein